MFVHTFSCAGGGGGLCVHIYNLQKTAPPPPPILNESLLPSSVFNSAHVKGQKLPETIPHACVKLKPVRAEWI